MPTPKIAIVGAGPGGLTLARLLQRNGLPCTVYEGEQSRNVRNQGGTLDLHPKMGQRALKEAGLIDEFKKHSRPEGQATKLLNYDGSVLWDDNGLDSAQLRQDSEEDRPEIDRESLRNILLDSVEPSSIQWNCKISRVERDARAPEKTMIHFADGSKESDIDLLVGADGAWSKVRPLLTDETPFYAGVTAVELWALNVSKTNPWLNEYVGDGSCYMFDEGRAIMAQRNGNDTVRVYACVRQPETWKEDCGIDWSNHQAAQAELVDRYFENCGEDLKRLVLECQDELVVRHCWMLPVGATWKAVPGVTLIGDAAHVMTPFAGVGGNLAMADALILARALISKKDGLIPKLYSNSHNIVAAIKEYEESAFPLAQQNAEKTAHGLKMHFSAGGGEERAKKFKAHYEAASSKQ